MPFIPHTKAETDEMLCEIGVKSIEELYDEIPKSLRYNAPLNIPEGLTEQEVKQLLSKKLKQDHIGSCFLGAGAYEHHIPAAVSDLISRGEFLTAYTPYQAEASQGNLQLIYEFQTMIASLMGLDASNASVYDGASALTEAILMAVRVNKSSNRVIIMPRTVHPAYRRVVRSIVSAQNIQIQEIDFESETGQTQMSALAPYKNSNVAAVVIPTPNFFGVLEDVDQLTNWAHRHGALAIGVVNPIAMSLLKEPGQWGEEGADIACGEGQSLGIPLASGGPYFGFMACKMKYVRQMPGRIVGRTVDQEGKEGFTLTLQAREQHIRRAKATSNICTNQGLMVTMATIHMSLLGAEGLRQVAGSSHAGAVKLLNHLQTQKLGQRIFGAPFFHEFAIRLNPPSIEPVLAALELEGIQAGYDLSKEYPELGAALLVCVTETKSEDDLVNYVAALKKITAIESRRHRGDDENSILNPLNETLKE
jgi:glycine dehydrogenase subunit 1